jgi:threonine/homoserine/homoserine lactone efflux protein
MAAYDARRTAEWTGGSRPVNVPAAWWASYQRRAAADTADGENMDLTLDLPVLATFTLMWLVIVPTPGANSLMVTHVALTRGPRNVALAIAGNMAGVALLGGLAVGGLAVVLEAFPWMRLAIQVLGAAYLVWFGGRLIARSRRPVILVPDGSPAPPSESGEARRTLALGFVTALSNAQAIVFVTSIYAVAGVLGANAATCLATIAIMIACNASYLSLLGWLFQRPPVRRGYARARRWLEAAIGALFVAFGLRLVVREVMALR